MVRHSCSGRSCRGRGSVQKLLVMDPPDRMKLIVPLTFLRFCCSISYTGCPGDVASPTDTDSGPGEGQTSCSRRFLPALLL